MNDGPDMPPAAVSLHAGDLLRALRVAEMVADKRGTVPILSHVRLTASAGQAAIEATNIEAGLRMEIDAWATAPVEMTFDPRRLIPSLEIVPQNARVGLVLMPGPKVRVSCGAMEMRLPGQPPEDMPALPGPPGDAATFECRVSDLRAMLDTCWRAISKEEVRYYLNGVYLHNHQGGLRAVATDGHRMIWRDAPDASGVPEGLGEIVPTDAIRTLRALLDQAAPGWVTIRVGVGDKGRRDIAFSAGGWRVSARCIDGTFPDYWRVVPKAEDMVGTLDVSRPQLLADLLRAVTARAAAAEPVRIAPGPDGGVLIHGGGHDIGQAALLLAREAAACSGEWAGCAVFQARYLHDLCLSLAEGFTLSANRDPEGPARFLGASVVQPAAGCIMPMRGGVVQGWEP